MSDLHLGLDRLVIGARGKCRADCLGEHARRERLVAQNETAGVGFGGIDDQRRKCSQMIGTAFDRVCPFALARAQIGRSQQFGKRHNAGEWRANIVSDAGEGGFDRARLRILCVCGA